MPLVSNYLNQNYELIKKRCLLKKQLFEDELFLANESSLFQTSEPDEIIIWKRPFEFIENPTFISARIDPSDLVQGRLGNCWFISAVTSISTVPEFANLVIPQDQTFETIDYAGIFHFRFWHFGEWIDVVVDDKLPVDQNNELIFCHNQRNKNELVGPLLEKAYAKLNRSYELLNGGNLTDALIDLTGGVNETFKLDELKFASERRKSEFWEIVFRSFRVHSFGGAVLKSSTKRNPNVYLSPGHSYCIMEPLELVAEKKLYNKLRISCKQSTKNSSKQSIRLLKISNPWGEDAWVGKWSRFSREWAQVSPELLEKLFDAQNTKRKSNGQFFISFEDFLENFDELYLVHTNLSVYNYTPTIEDFGNYFPMKWSCTHKFNGLWSLELETAGGCGNEDAESYWKNPKYLIKVSLDKLEIICSLMQTEQTRKRMESDGSYENSLEPIGFALFEVVDREIAQQLIINNEENDAKPQLDDTSCRKIASTGIYLYKREINKKISFSKSGTFLLIPSVFDKDVPLKYLLRIFAPVKSITNKTFSILDLNCNLKKLPIDISLTKSTTTTTTLKNNYSNREKIMHKKPEKFYSNSSQFLISKLKQSSVCSLL